MYIYIYIHIHMQKCIEFEIQCSYGKELDFCIKATAKMNNQEHFSANYFSVHT